MRHWLPGFAVRRPVTVIMAFLAMLVMGWISTQRIPLQMFPSGFTPPYIWVWVPYQDATPLETERQIVRPVEEQLATVPGIKELGSRASERYASFSLEFHQSEDMDTAYNAVVDRLERVLPELPEDVEDYGVFRYNPDDEAVIWAGISIPDEMEDVHTLMTDLVQARLERVPGVGKVELWGVYEQRVYVDFDRETLAAYGVNLYELMGQLGEDNFQLATGRLRDRGQVRYVRSLARYQTLDDLRQTPVKPGVVLDDVADVVMREAITTRINRLDGKDSAGIGIYKESQANTVEVGREVRAAFEELERDPRLDGLAFHSFFDQGDLIEDSIRDLVDTAIQGGMFAVVILFLFLREIRMTLLVAASIPFSLLMSVVVLYFSGGSLNLLSLLGLMIAVGMVVDNAIVVVEAIFRRRQEARDSGVDPPDPEGLGVRFGGRGVHAAHGAGEVNLAITLSTMTTMVVFLPLILMSGDATFSFFLGALGFPVVFALAASLVAALIFTPLSTVVLPDRLVVAEARWIRWLGKRYHRALEWVLRRRFDSFVGLLGILVVTAILPFQAVSCTEEAEGNLNDFVIRFEVPSDFSYSERVDIFEQVEAAVQEQHETWGVRVVRASMGSTSNRGTVYVYLEEDFEGFDRDTVLEAAEEILPDIAGVRMWTGWGGGGGNNSNTITVDLEGDDSEVLLDLSDEVLRRLRGIPGVLAAEHTLDESGLDEIRVHLDREGLGRYGLSAAQVGGTLAFAMRGRNLPDWHDGDVERSVLARFELADRADLSALLDFEIWSPVTQGAVPLRAVADPRVAKGFGTISRVNRKTALPLVVELGPGMTKEEGAAAIGAAIGDMSFPRGYGWSRGRDAQDQVENDAARDKAFLMSVIFVFLLMGILFESFLLPLSIITTIPMAMAGVYWTLYLTDTPLDLMAGVGLVVLVGVVVNNGIVLIDLVTQLRHAGMDRTQALLTAGERRMRPILMTALTTIFGLLPMALGSRSFLGLPYAPLGRVVAGGLATATLLTLFLLPFLYSVLDDLRSAAARLVAYIWIGTRPRETR